MVDVELCLPSGVYFEVGDREVHVSKEKGLLSQLLIFLLKDEYSRTIAVKLLIRDL